jgi:hypothetical protein
VDGAVAFDEGWGVETGELAEGVVEGVEGKIRVERYEGGY